MLILLVSWIILTLVFLSYGNMLIALWSKCSRANNDSYTFFDSFWIGLGFVSAIVCLLSLFLPLNVYVLSFLLLVSLIYWIAEKKTFILYFKNSKAYFCSLGSWYKVSIFLILAIAAVYTLKSLSLYDFGLYHEQTMMWAEQFSVVPGLGNIHGRFAFNSNFLFLSALFSYHPSYYMTFFPLNGLSFLIFFLWIFDKTVENGNVLQKMIGILIPFFLLFMFRDILSSTSTDILPSILILYMLITCVLDKYALYQRSLLFVVVTLACITFKLSSAPILLLLLPIFIYLLKYKQRKLLTFNLVLGAFIVIPWCIRFVVLSGYLVYPYPDIDIFSFDWKIPLEQVVYEKDSIKAWAILPEPSLSKAEILSMPLLQWLPMWWGTLTVFHKIIYSLTLVSPVLVLICRGNMRGKSFIIYAYLVAFIGSLIGFLAAPDLRFSYGITLFTGLFPLYLLFGHINFKRIIVYKSMIVCSLFVFFAYGCYNLRRTWYDEKPMISILLLPQSINRNTLFDYIGNQLPEVFTNVQQRGFELYIPTQGEQCYDFCLPCTTRAYNEVVIEQRGPTMQSGFRTIK